jgi:hypothetical protein
MNRRRREMKKKMSCRRWFSTGALAALAATLALAQGPPPTRAAIAPPTTATGLTTKWVQAVGQPLPATPGITRAVAIETSPIYLTPDATSAKVGQALPGRDVSVLGHSGHFVQVLADAPQGPPGETGIAGWMPDHGLVPLTQPNADEIILGKAFELERRAEAYPDQRDTAKSAALLYYRVYDDFPSSPLRAEGLFRAADIKWQLDERDMPATKDPSTQRFPDESMLSKVEHTFPHTVWAARAAYDRLDPRLACGDWIEKPNCAEKAAAVYRSYVDHYPDGPRTAEAYFRLVYALGASSWLYGEQGKHPDQGKAKHYRKLALETVQEALKRFPGYDWTARAELVQFELQQGLSPVAAPGQ